MLRVYHHRVYGGRIPVLTPVGWQQSCSTAGIAALRLQQPFRDPKCMALLARQQPVVPLNQCSSCFILGCLQLPICWVQRLPKERASVRHVLFIQHLCVCCEITKTLSGKLQCHTLVFRIQNPERAKTRQTWLLPKAERPSSVHTAGASLQNPLAFKQD